MNKLKRVKLKKEYTEHVKKIHNFIREFDKRDKFGRIIESGYEFMSKIQAELLDKYHDPDKLIELIGKEKWNYYKNLMMREKTLREKAAKI